MATQDSARTSARDTEETFRTVLKGRPECRGHSRPRESLAGFGFLFHEKKRDYWLPVRLAQYPLVETASAS